MSEPETGPVTPLQPLYLWLILWLIDAVLIALLIVVFLVGRPIALLRDAWRFFYPKGLPPGEWENCIADEYAHPAKLARPTTRAELLEVVEEARGKGLKVRAVGAGHSFSAAAFGEGLLIDPHGLKAVGPADTAPFREGFDASQCVRAECGVTIKELNDRLWDMKLALSNMGSYDKQTIAGAISTGTHGSGVGFGPLCDYVVSMEILAESDEGARFFRIEPADGPTDPAKHERLAPDTTLVQDDEAFRSAVVSMGCFGIVYSYTLKVTFASLLSEQRSTRPWSEVKGELARGDFAAPTHYEVYINPYAGPKERRCLVTTREPSKDPPRNHGERDRNRLTSLLTKVTLFDRLILWVMVNVPRLTRRMLDHALIGLKDRAYVDRCYRVLQLGDANRIPVYSSEIAFDATIVPGSEPAFLKAVEVIFATAREQAERGIYHTVPISLRFTKASEQYLAMQHGRVTCMIEIPFMKGSPGGWRALRLLERRLVALGGRPHWGQAHFHLGPDRLAAIYPELDTWMTQCLRFNRGTFDGVVSEMMGLRSYAKKLPDR